MRFLIREQDFEQLSAAGTYRYEQNGRPTGVTEAWRVTSVSDGYRFLRVDLDAREASSGNSYLYHVLLNDQGLPERIKYRAFGPQFSARGDLLVEAGGLTAVRQVNEVAFEEVVDQPPIVASWFPSVAGLGLLVTQAQKRDNIKAVSLDPAQTTPLSKISMDVACLAEETLAVAGRQLSARPCSIRWPGQQRDIWLDRYGWPVRMVRGDGLTAIETTYMRFKAREEPHRSQATQQNSGVPDGI